MIVHLDADAFFAAVEQASDPKLRGRPIAVGGEKRGIIASASYEARKFGVYTPMPTVRARKLCPKLIVLPGDFERYEQFSNWMFGYCYDFTPDVEQTSIDEGYFDLTANHKQPPVEIALKIRNAIGQKLKISVSEGIGSNKLVSAVASKLTKPAAFREVPPGQEAAFLQPLANQWLPGIGPKTSLRLNAAGLAQIRHVAATPLAMLELLLGSQAPIIRRFAHGIDDRPLIPAREPQKTFSQQETFGRDLTDEEYLEAVLRRMADRLFGKVREENRSVRTLTVKVRYNDMAEDQVSESLIEPTDLETDVYGRLHAMLRQAWKRRVSLRLVSLKLSNVYDGLFRSELPLTAEAQQRAARERLAVTLDELRRVKGWSVVQRGHDLILNEEGRRPKAEGKMETSGEAGGLRKVERPETAPDLIGHRMTATVSLSSPEGGEGRGEEARFDSRDFSRQPLIPALSPLLRRGEREKNSCSGSKSAQLRVKPSAFSLQPSAFSFVPLRCHSHYSFLDSTLSPTDIVQLAKQHKLPAVALTDTGNLHGAVEFTQAAQAAKLKPILGAELKVAAHPLLLYVMNATGYRNLCRLLSKKAEGAGNVEGRMKNAETASGEAADFTSAFSLQPSAFPSVAARQRAPVHSSFCIHHSSLLDGLLAVSSDAALAEFFPGRFYQMATRSRRREEADVGGAMDLRLLTSAATMRGVKNFPLIACPAVHYARPEDRRRYDILQSIRTLTLLDHVHPDKRRGGRYHFHTPAEMTAGCAAHPDWLRATREIMERCEFELPFGKPQFPAFATPDGSSSKKFLRRLVFDGLQRRYAGKRIVSDTGAEVPLSKVQAQIEEELGIIAEVGYEDYFLITWDFLQDCRARGIEWITRGSAADSLVCFCLGISDVCPIRYGLYFRRFLNRERMALHKLPDIDIDFAHDLRDDVVKLIFAKYGREHCAVVGGFSTFQARSAFAEVAKVLGVGERDVRKFTEHFPWGFGGGWVPDEPAPKGGAGLIELLRASPETRDLPFDEEPYKTALMMAEFLDGMPRYPKMHPCGLVLSRQPLHELTPTFIANKGYATAHFDMDAVEAIGLVKMDILAQGGLAVMRDVKASLVARGVEVDLNRCIAANRPSSSSSSSDFVFEDEGRGRGREEPWNDPSVWDMISTGNARAVHHIESPAMTGLCRMCNVREIDGLIAIVSVIRPGAANEGKKRSFTRRYQGLEPVSCPHPSLEPCLRSTFGLVVYEEHILQICEAFAGLPPGRADVLRRALNKQKRAVIEEIRGEFFASARARGHAPEKIEEVWGLVAGFAGYAFCKAHSTAYGVEAYQSAWLKLNFPAEFMAAVLTNGKGFYHPLVYVLESYRLGLKFLPPSVNQPGPAFKAEGRSADFQSAVSPSFTRPGARMRGSPGFFGRLAEWNSAIQQIENLRYIRVPLTRAKGLTERTIERLLAERERGPFASMTDFHRRVEPLPEELETMIRAGGFDEFGRTRTQQFWEAQYLRKAECRMQNEEFNFGEAASFTSAFSLQPSALLQEPSRRERLEAETELFGYAVSGHPLELFEDVAWETYCPVARLGEHVGETVVTCGLVVEQRTHHQITGEPMKFLTLADWTGMIETELFAQTYKSYGLATVRYPVLEVTATVEPFDNGRGFSLRVLRAGKPRSR